MKSHVFSLLAACILAAPCVLAQEAVQGATLHVTNESRETVVVEGRELRPGASARIPVPAHSSGSAKVSSPSGGASERSYDYPALEAGAMYSVRIRVTSGGEDNSGTSTASQPLAPSIPEAAHTPQVSTAWRESSASADLWDWAAWKTGGDSEMRELLDRAYKLYNPEPPKTTDGECPCGVREYEKERDKVGDALNRWWAAYGAVNGWKVVADASRTFGDAMATALKVYGFGTPEGDAVGGVVDRINETILNYGENKGTVVSAGVRASTFDFDKLMASLKTMKNWQPGMTLEERMAYAQSILDFRNEMRKVGDLGTLANHIQETGLNVRVAGLNDVLKFTDVVAGAAQTFVDACNTANEGAKYFKSVGEAMATLDEMRRAIPYYEKVMAFFRRQAASCPCDGDCSCAHCAGKRDDPKPGAEPVSATRSGPGPAPRQVHNPASDPAPGFESSSQTKRTNSKGENPTPPGGPISGRGGELMARYQQLRDQWVDFLENRQKQRAAKGPKLSHEELAEDFRRVTELRDSISRQINNLFVEDYRPSFGQIGVENEVSECYSLVPAVQWHNKPSRPGEMVPCRDSYKFGPVERCSDQETAVFLSALRAWAEAEERSTRHARWVFQKAAFLAAVRNPELYRYSYWMKSADENNKPLDQSRWEYTDYYYFLVVTTDNGPRILVYSHSFFKPVETGNAVDADHVPNALHDCFPKGLPCFKIVLPCHLGETYTFYKFYED